MRASREGPWPEAAQQALPGLAVSPSALSPCLGGAEAKAVSTFTTGSLGESLAQDKPKLLKVAFQAFRPLVPGTSSALVLPTVCHSLSAPML